QVVPNRLPARYDDTCVRTNRTPGRSRSTWDRIISPLATSTGSDLQARLSSDIAVSRGVLGLLPLGTVSPFGASLAVLDGGVSGMSLALDGGVSGTSLALDGGVSGTSLALDGGVSGTSFALDGRVSGT